MRNDDAVIHTCYKLHTIQRRLCHDAHALRTCLLRRVLWQGYWQSAIAAKPSAAHTGYLLGGIMWFCIPFTLATTMGLSALALDLPITIAEAGQGDRLPTTCPRVPAAPMSARSSALVSHYPRPGCLDRVVATVPS